MGSSLPRVIWSKPTIIIKMVKLFILFICTLLPLIYAWPGGAPEGACETFRPQHDGVEPQDLESAQFFLKFRSASARGKNLAKLNKGVLPIKIRAEKDFSGEQFKGFLVQARNAADDKAVGAFVLTNKADEEFRMQHLLVLKILLRPLLLTLIVM